MWCEELPSQHSSASMTQVGMVFIAYMGESDVDPQQDARRYCCAIDQHPCALSTVVGSNASVRRDTSRFTCFTHEESLTSTATFRDRKHGDCVMEGT